MQRNYRLELRTEVMAFLFIVVVVVAVAVVVVVVYVLLKSSLIHLLKTAVKTDLNLSTLSVRFLTRRCVYCIANWLTICSLPASVRDSRRILQQRHNTIIRYDTRSYFNVHRKAGVSHHHHHRTHFRVA